MKTDVECVLKSDTVQVAARKMRDANIGFLPVCADDKSRKVIGTVTDRDLAIRILAESGKSVSSPVGDAMSHEVVACSPDDDLSDAEEMLARHRKSRIMCIDDGGKLVGVISLSDIAQIADEEGAATLRKITEREAAAP